MYASPPPSSFCVRSYAPSQIKYTTQLGKVFAAYCGMKNISADAVVFMFDADRLHIHQTPASVGLEDGDEIQVLIHQHGGGMK